MTVRASRVVAIAAGVLALASAAQAAPGYVLGGVDLRAGPGVEYPPVAPLAPGTPTEIFGCLPGWTWCDIGVNGPGGGLRGWAAGSRLQLLYGNQAVLLPEYGAQLGLPLIGFDLDRYWGSYYRNEPWFADAGRWRGGFRGRPDPVPGGYGPRGGPGGFGGRPPGEFHGGGPGPHPGGGYPGGRPEGGFHGGPGGPDSFGGPAGQRPGPAGGPGIGPGGGLSGGPGNPGGFAGAPRGELRGGGPGGPNGGPGGGPGGHEGGGRGGPHDQGPGGGPR